MHKHRYDRSLGLWENIEKALFLSPFGELYIAQHGQHRADTPCHRLRGVRTTPIVAHPQAPSLQVTFAVPDPATGCHNVRSRCKLANGKIRCNRGNIGDKVVWPLHPALLQASPTRL